MPAMAIDRRTLLHAFAGALTLLAEPALALSASRELFVSARREPDGSFAAVIFDDAGNDLARVPLPGRGHDSTVRPGSGECVAGICHARGSNAELPPQWLMYVTVEDVDRSAARCTELGGQVLVGPKPLAGGRFCVIRDPAGAVCALYRPPE